MIITDIMNREKPIYFSFAKAKIVDKSYSFLSNFYPSPFTKDGTVYQTVEHFFQSEKFTDAEKKHSVVTAKSPTIAKRLGRKWKVDPAEWELKKEQIMKTALELKFSQNQDLKDKLIATSNRPLIEYSKRDKYWGGSIAGAKNRLGILLMELRDSLSSN